MREPPLERIADEIMLVGARKGLDDHLARMRHARKIRLQRQPFAHLIRQAAPRALVVEQVAHAFGKIGRERKLAAHIGRHLRALVIGARDIDLIFHQRLVAHDLAAEHEGIAGDEAFDEIFLDLAEHAAAARNRAGRAFTWPPCRERTSFTFNIASSTMVPTLRR